MGCRTAEVSSSSDYRERNSADLWIQRMYSFLAVLRLWLFFSLLTPRGVVETLQKGSHHTDAAAVDGLGQPPVSY